jgi:hypothetical protein
MDDTFVRDGMLSVMRENPEQPQGIVEDIFVYLQRAFRQ